MQRFLAFNKKITFFGERLGFYATEKCSTLTNWHTSNLDSAHIN